MIHITNTILSQPYVMSAIANSLDISLFALALTLFPYPTLFRSAVRADSDDRPVRELTAADEALFATFTAACSAEDLDEARSEERRVGKECRLRRVDKP